MLKKILLIDDDIRLRKLLSKLLLENEFQTIEANNTKEAEEILKKDNDFDVIILDVMLPNESGVDFANRIRKKNNIPILMLTALNNPKDRILGLESGADDYLAKPFESKELILRINNILRRIDK